MMKQYWKITLAVFSVMTVFLFASCPQLTEPEPAAPVTPAATETQVSTEGAPAGSVNPPVTPPAAGRAAPSFFWGNWVRMDNGQEYLITETKMVTGGGTSHDILSHTDTSITTSIGTLTKQTDNVIQLGNVPFFRKGSNNVAYTLNLVGFSNSPARSAMASGALANQKVTVTSNTFTTYAEEQYTDAEGKVVLHTPVAGSENIITVTTADGSEVTATVAPQNSGEDAGTIAVVPQGMYSLKVTGQIDKTQTARDNGYLFAGDQYSLSVSIENITYIKAKTSEVRLTSNTPELHIIGENSFAISTFMRPDKKTEVFQIQCDSFEAPYIDASIGVSIRDMDGNIWNDSISLRFFRERK